MTFDRRFLLLGLLPLSIYLLVYIVVDQARPTGIVFETIPASQFAGVAAEEGQLRYFWMSSFILLTAVALAVTTSAGLALWRETPVRDKRLVFGLIALFALGIIAVEVLGLAQRWYTYLGEGLFLSIFPNLKAAAGWSAFSVFLVGQEIVKGSAAIALLLLTGCLILSLARPRDDAPLAVRIKHLAAASARQRTYLEQAALVYVFAIIVVVTWMYWPLPFLASDAVRTQYNSLATGAVVLQGVMLSLGVAAIYLPPALVLRHRAVALQMEVEARQTQAGVGTSPAPASTEPLDAEAAAALECLEPHPFDHLRQLVMMVLPAVVSVLPSILPSIGM